MSKIKNGGKHLLQWARFGKGSKAYGEGSFSRLTSNWTRNGFCTSKVVFLSLTVSLDLSKDITDSARITGISKF